MRSESATYAKFGSVIVDWSPSIAPLGEGEDLFEEGGILKTRI